MLLLCVKYYKAHKHNTSTLCGSASFTHADRFRCLNTDLSPSAARLLRLRARLGDEESFEEEELQVAGGDDEEAEDRRPPGDVLGVGQQQEVVGTLPHAAESVVTKHVEDGARHSVTRIL